MDNKLQAKIQEILNNKDFINMCKLFKSIDHQCDWDNVSEFMENEDLVITDIINYAKEKCIDEIDNVNHITFKDEADNQFVKELEEYQEHCDVWLFELFKAGW